MSFNVLSDFWVSYTNPPQMDSETREREEYFGLFMGGYFAFASYIPLYCMCREEADPLERVFGVASLAIFQFTAYTFAKRYGNLRNQDRLINYMHIPIPVDNEEIADSLLHEINHG